MPIDTSVYNLLAQQPRKTALDYQGEFEQRDIARQNALLSQESARQGIAMNALQMRGAQRAEAEDQAWRNYLAGGGDLSTPEGQRQAMAVSPKAAGAYMTQQAELASKAATADKARADAQKTQYDLHRRQVENGLMMAVNGSTPDAIRQSVSEGVRGGLWSDQEAREILSDLPQDGSPQSLMQWRVQQIQTALSAKDQLEAYMKRDQMAAEDARAAEARKVQMRGQDISAQTTMRGQNMTDARSREKNQIDRDAVGKVEWKQDVNGNWIGLPKEVSGKAPVTPVAVNAPGKREMQARNAVDIINQAEQLIDKGTSSYLGAAVDQGARVFGASTAGADAAAQLKALEGALMMAQPRMEGPQSDKDVALYRQMAAQIGDPTVPASQKRAALGEIRKLHERYAGGETVQQSTSPARISGDAEYNALPSGAVFIGPDGKQRRKP